MWNSARPRLEISRPGSPQCAETFKVGDHVSSNSEAGRVSGTVISVHTADFDYKGVMGLDQRRLGSAKNMHR